MKTLELDAATAPLSDYAEQARKEPLLFTVKGKPLLALSLVGTGTDLENLAVSADPRFLAILERSTARHTAEGGLSTAQMRQRLAARRRAKPRSRSAR